MRTKIFLPLFRKTRHDLGEVDTETLLYSNDRDVEIFTTVAIFLAGAIMLVAPLWILQAIHVFQGRLVVITVFILVFLSILTWSTVGKPFEVLAATAG